MIITCLHVSPWRLIDSVIYIQLFLFQCKTLAMRKTPFLLRAGLVTPCPNWIDKDEFTPWVILYQCNFSSSDQLDISLVQYDTHLFLVIFPLALQFSQIFIFRSHRDNFIKFLKIITVSFFLVNNSRQFCTKYFCSQKRRCPVKSPEGDTKLKESHQ